MFNEKMVSCRALLLLQNTAITNILEKRLVFERLDAIIKANEQLKVYNIFWDWYFYNYIDSQVMELMRILDQDESSKNFTRLLDSLLSGATVDAGFFTRIHEALKSASGMASPMFDSLVPLLTTAEIEADKTLLESETNVVLVRNYRDWKVAHNDPQKWERLGLNLAKLNECIDLVHEKVRRYELFLNGSGYPDTGLTPTITYDWEAIFRVPWINS